MKRLMIPTLAAGLCFAAGLYVVLIAQDWRSGIAWEKPAIVTPGEKPGDPPSDAIILFDGTDLSAWDHQQWTVEDGVLTVKPGTGDIRTRQHFGSVQLHLEFATPAEVSGSSQGRGNSGVFFNDAYEVQILDSYDNETYYDGQCASIYKQRAPLVNVCRKPGEWQTFDIIYTAPVFKGKSEVVSPARITVLQNGVVIQYDTEIQGKTEYIGLPSYTPHGRLPITLQDHGDAVSFRNIWIRDL